MNGLMRRITTEFVGTAFLLMVVVGSGIMGERLANGNAAIALLANSIASGAGLIFLILAFEAVSAHFNPLVTLTEILTIDHNWKKLFIYTFVQIFGAIAGVGMANLMFDLPFVFISTKARTGFSQWLSEAIATFGLIMTIRFVVAYKPQFVALSVGCYITAAYWFTGSTSFANPAVAIARGMSNTFAGIRPADILPFIAAQTVGAVVAIYFCNWLIQTEQKDV